MKHRNDRLLVYIAMADAYAAATEYLKLPQDQASKDEALRFEGYVAHPTYGIGAGFYTDDTEMSVANAQVLIDHGLLCAPRHFADAYVSEFVHGGRRKGYARAFQSFLESIQDGTEFLDKIKSESNKNGAAMRAAPIGVLPNILDVIGVATLQAQLTHNTPEGRFSARAVAVMSHAALYSDVPLAKLGDCCVGSLPLEDLEHFGHVFTGPWSGESVRDTPELSVAITTVHAVVSVLAQETTLMGMLERLIRWGGDTDSVAAIAWGIASSRLQNEVLPEFMERDLERGSVKTGVPRLLSLGTQLMGRFAE
ncbi:ADP-ribosylglycohydrolase family protein [Patescibacteria group bacterium]|nr:ADP-ribosylglycohydrolase family protein [Patescibacteria group bacterium]